MTHKNLKDHNQQVIQNIESPDNRWFTGQEVKHEPNNNELAIHYIKNVIIQDLKKATTK